MDFEQKFFGCNVEIAFYMGWGKIRGLKCFFSFKRDHIHAELAKFRKKVYILRERFSFHNILQLKIRGPCKHILPLIFLLFWDATKHKLRSLEIFLSFCGYFQCLLIVIFTLDFFATFSALSEFFGEIWTEVRLFDNANIINLEKCCKKPSKYN